MIRYGLLAVIGIALIFAAPPASSHYPIAPEPKDMDELDFQHERLHVLKGHAWAEVKHPRSYKDLVWHRKALRRINVSLRKNHRQLQIRRYARNPVWAIYQVFGVYGEQAVEVARCETGGTFDTGAQNGQYLGLFQMGDYARSRYGHSSTALGQAQAAYRYFMDSGRDWSPWACKP